jgi:hypothetical protein
MMKQDQRKRLERAGWRVADARDLLELSDDERRFGEMKSALAAGFDGGGSSRA